MSDKIEKVYEAEEAEAPKDEIVNEEAVEVHIL